MKYTAPRPSRAYLQALAELHAPAPDRSRDAWHALDREAQAEAVRRMAASGMADYAIASATGLAVEAIRQTIGARS